MMKYKKAESIEDLSHNLRTECINDRRIALIKNDVCDGKHVWSIYTEEGVKIADTENRDFAFIMARRNNLQPHSVH